MKLDVIEFNTHYKTLGGYHVIITGYSKKLAYGVINSEPNLIDSNKKECTIIHSWEISTGKHYDPSGAYAPEKDIIEFWNTNN